MRARYILFFCFSALAVVGGLLGSGCSTSTAAFYGIANRGITPVSPQNPYMGSNVFLAQEMERSLFLYKFLDSRGSPQAIQLNGSSEMDAELVLFYSDNREYYSAIPHIDRSTKGKEWIIRGPFPLTREHYPLVAHLRADAGGVFEVFGRQERFGGPASAFESRTISPAFIPTPSPTPTPLRKRSKNRAHTPIPQESIGPAVAVQGTPLNLDQEALLEARRTPVVAAAALSPTAQPVTNTVGTPGQPTLGPKALGAALKSAVTSPPETISEQKLPSTK